MDLDDIIFGVQNFDKPASTVLGKALLKTMNEKKAELDELEAQIAELESQLAGKQAEVDIIDNEIEQKINRIDALEQVEEGR